MAKPNDIGAASKLELAWLDMIRVGLRHERHAHGTEFAAAAKRVKLLLVGTPFGVRVAELVDRHISAVEDESVETSDAMMGPTAATIRHRQGVVLLRMRKAGKLTERQLTAATLIRSIAEGGSAVAGVIDYTAVRVDTSRRVPTEPAGLAILQSDRDNLERWEFAMKERLMQVAAIKLVVLHDYTLTEAERECHMRTATLATAIGESLELFALIANIPKDDAAARDAA